MADDIVRQEQQLGEQEAAPVSARVAAARGTFSKKWGIDLSVALLYLLLQYVALLWHLAVGASQEGVGEGWGCMCPVSLGMVARD